MFSDLLRTLLAPSVYNASKEPELLMRYFSEVDMGVFVDIGANVPESAVSLPFLKAGWTGVAVDPIPENAESLRKAGYDVWCGAVTSEVRAKEKEGETSFFVAGGTTGRKSSLEPTNIDPALCLDEIVVPLVTLSDLMLRFGLTRLDLLSVDVEGCEADVLSTMDESTVSGLLLVEDWARDTSLHSLIVSKGYKRVRRTGYNSWYVPAGAEFPLSVWGWLHLVAKLNLFCVVRRWRFERRKRAYDSVR
jgi:FkbM family methyltransferase